MIYSTHVLCIVFGACLVHQVITGLSCLLSLPMYCNMCRACLETVTVFEIQTPENLPNSGKTLKNVFKPVKCLRPYGALEFLFYLPCLFM